jgi:hypothetical protein
VYQHAPSVSSGQTEQHQHCQQQWYVSFSTLPKQEVKMAAFRLYYIQRA